MTCRNSAVSEAPSPGAELKAIVFTRDCGATTTWATHVTVTEKLRLLPNVVTLVFVADGNHGRAPQGPAYAPEARVHWRDGRHLVIAHHEKAMVFQSSRRVGEVRVEYERFDE